ncbi:MAG: metal ABC transporter ATP-binding protein [Candidatus Omnitrophota bacterium]
MMPEHVYGACCTEIAGLDVSLGRIRVLENINLRLNCGELVAVIGPNGAGKTTLLKAILGEVAYSGQIRFSIRGSLRQDIRIGYVPQKLSIDYDTPVSVLDFVSMAVSSKPVWLRLSGGVKDKVHALLTEFSCQHLVKRKIGALSGGELQRVLLAAAMTPAPDLLLLDEPVSAIDAKGLALFYELVCDVRRKYDVSVLLVTHDLADVAPHADRMIFLKKKILAQGKPQDVLSDRDLLMTLGPSVWNISELAGFKIAVKEKDTHDADLV